MVSRSIAVSLGIVIAIVIIIVILIVTFYSGFNAALAKKEKVKRLVADTDTQLQRRYDLIPN